MLDLLADSLTQRLFVKMRDPLVLFGLLGQGVFMLRFVVQWYVSEKLRRSHVPLGFWYLSLAGGVMLMIYGILDADPVIILGQSLGLLIYARNLMLIHGAARRFRTQAAAQRPVAMDNPTTN